MTTVSSGTLKPITIATALLLSACATDVYEGEVTSFAKSVDTLNKSFEKIVVAESDAYFTRQAEFITGNTAALRLGDGSEGSSCRQIDALLLEDPDEQRQIIRDQNLRTAIAQCDLYYQTSQNGRLSDPKILAGELDVKNGRLLIRELTIYSKNLADVAAAKDVDELNKSAAKLRESVGSLVGTAGLSMPALAPITAGVNIVSKGVLWVFSKSQEYQRFVAFKEAVIAADDAVLSAADPLGAQLAALNRQLIRHQSGVLNDQLSTPPKSKADVEKAIKEYDALIALASYNARAVAQKMADAHHKLKQAVEDPKTQKRAVIAALKEFKDLVNEVSDAIEKLNKETG